MATKLKQNFTKRQAKILKTKNKKGFEIFKPFFYFYQLTKNLYLSFKKHSYLKKTTFYLALLLLNISVDAPISNHITFRENLNYNKQESIVEIIVEKIFGEENAFEEFEDLDNNSIQKKDFKLDFQAYISSSTYFQLEILKEQICTKYSFSSKPIFQEVTSPPPQV